jgi:hypothetical protein
MAYPSEAEAELTPNLARAGSYASILPSGEDEAKKGER